jgi:hypothetical protein
MEEKLVDDQDEFCFTRTSLLLNYSHGTAIDALGGQRQVGGKSDNVVLTESFSDILQQGSHAVGGVHQDDRDAHGTKAQQFRPAWIGFGR